MKNRIILILSLFSINIFAQNKNFTMQEAVLGLSNNLAVKNLKQLAWTGNNNIFAQLLTIDSVEKIIETDATLLKNDTLFDLPTLNAGLQEAKLDTFSKFPTINWINNTRFYVVNNKSYYECTYSSTKTIYSTLMYTLPEDAENIDIEPNTQNVAYTLNYNLYVCKKNEKPIQITKDGTSNLLYGYSVHRDEFGIDHGIFWSPTGDKLAFYKMDQSMVTDYPIIDWTALPAKVNNIKYPFAGNASHHVNVLTYNVATNKIAILETGEPLDQYLTCVTWSPDEQHLYIGVLNREQNYLKLNKYGADVGVFVKTILEEKNEKYVEPQHPLYFFNNDNDAFIWWSQRDGFMHLYLVNETNGETKQLTNGNWIVNEVKGYNAKLHEIIYTSTQDGPLDKNIYAIDITDKKIRRLNRNNGWHSINANYDATYIIDNYSNALEPKSIELLSVNTDVERRLLTAQNPLAEYAMSTVKLIQLKANDNTKLYGKLILPYNFDNSKKYPTIVYLYNGPHAQMVTNKFPESGNLWYDLLTQRGYIVFVMDGRGSANRGFEFESATHRKLGTIEMEDQMKGVEFLQSLPYVDTTKMGIHGWSFGGFITTSFMLSHPGVFKCAVAGGPVMDWSKYEIMYTERYMGTPQNNKEGYENNCLLSKTKNLQGKLLLIHGAKDETVVWQHTQAFLKNCIDNGVQVDYFDYPTHEHNVRGKDRVHLMQKITDYFDLWLK